MKSLHTYQEEVKARFDLLWAKDDEPRLRNFAADFLKDATTQAYLLGLKRGLELLPERDNPKLGSENQDLYVDFGNGFNSCLTKVETALTQEIDKLTN